MKEKIISVKKAANRIINVAIIEENTRRVQELCAAIERFAEEKKCIFHISVVNSVISFIGEYRNNFDILFISVEHSELGGLAIAQRLRRYDDDVLIMLSSDSVDAAMDGYSVRAFSYLLKDADYFSFAKSLNAAVEQINDRPAREYIIYAEDAIYRLQIGGIEYVEVRGHSLYFHTMSSKEEYVQRGSMIKIEQEFSSSGFFRVNKSYLINLSCVTAVRGNVVIIRDMEIPISRNRRKEFNLAFKKLLSGAKTAGCVGERRCV